MRSGEKRRKGLVRLFLPHSDHGVESFLAVLRWGTRALLASFVVLAVWGSNEILKRVQADGRFYLDNWRFEVGPLPDWVTPEIRAELEGTDLSARSRAIGMTGRLSLFEPGVLKKVKTVLESSPWIHKIVDMRVGYPALGGTGVLELELELRQPVAFLEQGGLYYLVDSEATRLGWPYRDPATRWFGIPAIIGLPPGALPEQGAHWVSRDVLQGIEVAKILMENNIVRDFPDRPIHAIDLSNLHGRLHPRESEVTLLCGGQKLAWGRSPLSAGARPVPVTEIVKNLRLVLSHPETFENYTVIHLHRRPEDLTGIRG